VPGVASLRAFLSLSFGVAVAASCGTGEVPSPFREDDDSVDAGADAPSVADAGIGEADASSPPPGLGGPCVDDEQCDDGIACTFDACDPVRGRCLATPDDAACADVSFCNGVEICDLRLGCREGTPVDCSDATPCTIDSCNETTRTCEHDVRDADRDGDPDVNCPDGNDCDERNPAVSSLAPEVCNNSVDDDCDGESDEDGCVDPEYDTCIDALEVAATGQWELEIAAARGDYAASCVDGESPTRDLVVAVIVPDGEPMDVDVTAVARSGAVTLAIFEACGDAASEIACAPTAETPARTRAARLKLRGAAPGARALYVISDGTAPVTLAVTFSPATVEPPNETCASALPLEEGVPTRASLVDAAEDVATACDRWGGDLVFSFDVSESRDVRVVAETADGLGAPSISLRTEACSDLSDEIVCRTAVTGDVFWRGLGAGRYYVSVAATGPTDVDVLLVTTPPTEPPADESCESTTRLEPNRTVVVDLASHVDDIRLGCSLGFVDAAYELKVEAATDVLLVQRITDGDRGVVALADAACGAALSGCTSGVVSPIRASKHDLSAGTYRVVVETESAATSTITAFSRAAQAPIVVAFADDCAAAIDVPPTGGFFIGNTSNATSDYSATCDRGGLGEGGGADQMLRLVLDERRRVILDMRGSSYATLLTLRDGCPGTEMEGACSAGYAADRSYLDLELDAGEYFLQIDGYAAAEGPWFLEVFVVSP
jgi:hypothetical protein